MEDIKFSVIIPVYNVEKYLKECLDSILAYKGDLEVIAVDDGSTDSSGKMLDEYKDERLKVFHKENEGLFKTWKYGVNQSTGEYIIFVDSDDYIDSKLFADMQELLREKSYDLIQYDWICSEEGKLIRYHDYSRYEKGSFEQEALTEFLNRHLYRPKDFKDCFPFYRWGKVFRAEPLKELLPRLLEDITMFEDESLVIPYLTTITSLYVSEKSYYIYRYNRPGSICTAQKTLQKFEDCKKVLSFIRNFADDSIMKNSKRIYCLRNLYCLTVEAIESKNYALAKQILQDDWVKPVIKEEKGFKYFLLRARMLRTFRLLRSIMLKFRREKGVAL